MKSDEIGKKKLEEETKGKNTEKVTKGKKGKQK